MRKLIRAVVLAGSAFCLVAGCSAPTNGKFKPQDIGEDDPSPPEPTKQADAELSPATPSATTTTTPSETVWTGTLAKAPTALFGGSPFCNYRVTFTDLQMSLVVGPDGVVKTSEVTGTMTEEAVDCAYPPIAANTSVFSLKAGSKQAGLDVTLSGSPKNTPQSELEFQGATDKDGTIAGTIRIHRTDIDAPLDWTVVANIRLSKSS